MIFGRVASSLTLVAFLAVSGFAQDVGGKKVLYIDSYHQGYPWSDGVTAGIQTTIEPTGAVLEIVRMDTKRNNSDAFKKQAAEKVVAKIEEMKPDVVIASDDNAANFVISKHYKESETPFVFCGVNWDASAYGFPCSNVTGMIEVAPAKQLVGYLSKHADGNKVGYLAADNETERKEAAHIKKKFGIDIQESFVTAFDDWKASFAAMQTSVDMLILGVYSGIEGWDDAEANSFVAAETAIPAGAMYDYMGELALLALTKKPYEQGEYAALTALRILKGTKPADIPVAMNKQSDVIVNMKLANKLGVTFDVALLKMAKVIK
jgi:ABC-type uncharacterized transport system substrate-binding protein